VPHRVNPPHDVTAGVRGIRLPDIGERSGVTQDSDHFLQLGKILGADQYRGIPAISGDHHAVVLALDVVDELGEVVPC
jgi:hypothetical protein